jgi:FMN reductase
VTRVTTVVGNPNPASRTLTIAEEVAQRATASLPTPVSRTVDLADYANGTFRWPYARLAAIGQMVATSDVVAFASPTYKASFTGLLKAFLDRNARGDLTDVTAAPVTTGGPVRHSMGIDTASRPVLVELGACMAARSLYFVTEHLDELQTSSTRGRDKTYHGSAEPSANE